MIAYEISTVVRDAHIEVDPRLNGRQVRVVVLTDETPTTEFTRRAALDRMFANRSRVEPFAPLTRDEANARS